MLNDYYLLTEVAYVKTENKNLDESLPLNPPFISKISVGVDKEKYWAKALYNIVSKQENIAPSFGETVTKGYQTFDENYPNHLNFSYKN